MQVGGFRFLSNPSRLKTPKYHIFAHSQITLNTPYAITTKPPKIKGVRLFLQVCGCINLVSPIQRDRLRACEGVPVSASIALRGVGLCLPLIGLSACGGCIEGVLRVYCSPSLLRAFYAFSMRCACLRAYLLASVRAVRSPCLFALNRKALLLHGLAQAEHASTSRKYLRTSPPPPCLDALKK